MGQALFDRAILTAQGTRESEQGNIREFPISEGGDEFFNRRFFYLEGADRCLPGFRTHHAERSAHGGIAFSLCVRLHRDLSASRRERREGATYRFGRHTRLGRS